MSVDPPQDELDRRPPPKSYPKLELLSGKGPIVWSVNTGRWLVLGYEAARYVLRDDTYLTDDGVRRLLPRLSSQTGHQFLALQQLHDSIPFFIDPPVHTAVRRLLARLLGTWSLAELRKAADGLVVNHLTAAQRQGGFDLMLDFARYIPSGLIALILGIPEEDLAELAPASHIFMEIFDIILPFRNYRKVDNAARILLDYFERQVRMRRQSPRDDGISYLIRMADEDSKFSDTELAGFCAVMYFAGQETTAAFIAGGGATLLQNRQAIATLRQNPSKLPKASDDLARDYSAVQAVGRVASADRMVGGQKIRAGDRLAVHLAAANHDPTVFPTGLCPFLGDSIPPHLAFGAGQHLCLGAALARTEGVAAFKGLLELPNEQLRFGEPIWVERRNLRRLESLPVQL